MFGTSGIRGQVGDVVTAELAVKLGNAVAGWGANRVVVGRDPRPTGNYLSSALCSGLREGGVDVIDIGIAATPTVARSVEWCDADAGVVVTASHNPPTDNGFKFWLPSGQAFRPDEQRELEAHISGGRTATSPWNQVGGNERWERATARHVEALVNAVELESHLRVVVDVGNGTGQLTAKALEELGCTVTTLNGQQDGMFPGRPSEPNAEHCQDLQAVVPAIGADIGIAHDGDADRMRAVDERGTFLTGDALLTIFGINAAAAGECVVAPVDTSLAVEDAFAERGIELVRTRVGDVFVAEGIRESDAVFGGEPSGAWIWPAHTYCPDGPLAACVLAELVGSGEPLSSLLEAFERYPIRREAIEVKDKPRIMQRVNEAIASQFESVETLDGVRVTTEEGWFLIRPSGTEPVIRVTAEARREVRADSLLEEARDLVLASVTT